MANLVVFYGGYQHTHLQSGKLIHFALRNIFAAFILDLVVIFLKRKVLRLRSLKATQLF